MLHIMMNGKPNLVLDRRKFLGAGAALVAAGLLPRDVWALAAPYSFSQGAYDVTVVSDGTLLLPLSIISPDAKPDDIVKLLGPMVQGDKAEFQANPLLLKSASDVILMDTGSGAGFQPTAGKIADSLKAAGTDPASVTKVIFTHAHPDHFWGTIDAEGKPIFPNATLHMAEAEWNFWAAPDLAGKMPEGMRGMVTGTQTELAAMKEKMNFFKPGTEIVSGIAAIDTAGHTPGHVSFEIAGGDGLIVTGDALTNPFVFFTHPDWKFGFDADGDAAIASRKKMLDMAATGKKKLLGFHWPYPGLGMAEAKDGAYVYVSVA
jgi:glyoxylase-like metal-dependent hydrolase (beta-lactamase superfamily II)